ncbi:hypothetical protein LguiB_015757 [Lonicera macranthoides]
MPPSLLFVKFNFRPEIEQNNESNFNKFINLPSSPDKKKIVSSANCRCDISTLSFPTTNPSITPSFLAFSINLPKQSATNMNKNGERGSPCLNPLEAPNFPLGLPLTKTEKLTDVKQPLIHFLHLTLNPLFSKTSSKKFQSTWSKAFSKSILNTAPSFFFLIYIPPPPHWLPTLGPIFASL